MNNSTETREILSNKRKLKISLVLFLVSAALFLMSRYIDNFSDLYYKYIYIMVINTIPRGFSLIPFSVYEIILYGFSIFILVRLIRYIYLGITKKLSFKKIIIRATSNFLIYVSVFLFLNMIALGVNSFRTDFVTLTNLKVSNNSDEERLIEICERFKDKLNELDGKIQKDQNGFLKLDTNVRQEGRDNMKNLGKTYSFLQGYYPIPKPYIFSKVMSYQLLEGETNFTLEANYNNDMPQVDIPSTICHELSHVKGFINEYEANYISFLACINSNSYEYQYSGYFMAYSYCMSDLYYSNLDAFKKINGELSDNVKLELKNEALFWDSYRGGISDLYDNVYDKILKAGGQEDGIRSYNVVVKLLMAGYGDQFK
ncbi:DUF3810 domain-containing protein [uncultured Clostridium sp.]|uniref:DUF3810 domain-containing protein n=1 Tax=uncultured Clostridium sp. TaxID=59620 RepID=UPI0028EC69A3|nr:DUF3810 domain-containing protein [uncultured Clostridium sp.]